MGDLIKKHAISCFKENLEENLKPAYPHAQSQEIHLTIKSKQTPLNANEKAECKIEKKVR